tara:strand:+ start:4 stop:120 length:117 start_codon:yes stop_codon:yes gene_type:complete
MTEKVICPNCLKVHPKSDPCNCEEKKEVDYIDPNPFDR